MLKFLRNTKFLKKICIFYASFYKLFSNKVNEKVRLFVMKKLNILLNLGEIPKLEELNDLIYKDLHEG